MSPLKIFCPICKEVMDYHKGYGRDQRCCGRQCYEEFDWRMALSILDREYYPDPRKIEDGIIKDKEEN